MKGWKVAQHHPKRAKASPTQAVGFFMLSNTRFTLDSASLAASLLCRNAKLTPKTWSICKEVQNVENIKLIKTFKQTNTRLQLHVELQTTTLTYSTPYFDNPLTSNNFNNFNHKLFTSSSSPLALNLHPIRLI
jgi:hypothetical protein